MTGKSERDVFLRWFWGPDARWKKYISNIQENAYEPLLSAWGSHYCREYNIEKALPEGERLATLEILLIWRHSYAPGEPLNPFQTRMLWKHWCYPEYEY
ncbi:MAG TPA: hypothetical protein VJZ27_08585 [Aggregatilineales bacterium]|nr:hypothetical protein [Aggregatilineales bacterium]